MFKKKYNDYDLKFNNFHNYRYLSNFNKNLSKIGILSPVLQFETLGLNFEEKWPDSGINTTTCDLLTPH